MAKDPDSRPISVSELLARRQREDSASETPATGANAATGGRRRVGRDGAMSVAELTGEIPKVPSAADDSKPGDSKSHDAKSGDSRSGDAKSDAAKPRSSSPIVTRTQSSFPLASPPRAAAPGAESEPDRPAPPARTASGMPGSAASASESPRTRDFNANAVTGVIPPVDEPADQHTAPVDAAAADDDLDFEAYRSFADYDDGEDDHRARKTKKARGARGVFGRKKQAERSRGDRRAGSDGRAGSDERARRGGPVVGGDGPATDDGDRLAESPNEQTTTIPVTDDAAVRPAVTPSVRRRDAETSTAAPAPTDDVDSGPLITPHVVARTSTAPRPESAVDDTQQINVVRSDRAAPPAESEILDAPEPASTDSDTKRSGGRAARRLAGIARSDGDSKPVESRKGEIRKGEARKDEARDEAPLAAKHSPLMQWLILAGQSVLGLAIGVGLFWGFTELWKWNPIFAVVLAALVVFGIVTLVHLVRRTHDLLSTLLALGVGLIVTIGPLVLLTSTSS